MSRGSNGITPSVFLDSLRLLIVHSTSVPAKMYHMQYYSLYKILCSDYGNNVSSMYNCKLCI